jgi:hypothetical protein
MPIKSRVSKRTRHHVTDTARAIWRSCGPEAIHLAEGGPGFIADDALAEGLGLPALIWLPDMEGLADALGRKGT